MADENRSPRQPGAPSAAFSAALGLAATAALFDLSLHAGGMTAAEALQTFWLWLALACLPALVLACGIWLWQRAFSGGNGRWSPADVRARVLVTLAAAALMAPAIALLHAARPPGVIAALSGLVLIGTWPLGSLATRSRRVRRGALATSALCGALASIAGLAPDPADPADRTGSRGSLASDRLHVVLIVLDTQRADHLGAYGGGALSPNFDALAQASTLYENCFATAAWTVPSHASLFTGLHPISHGASFEHHRWLDARFETLAEALLAAGYRTAGFSANEQLGLANLDQGFEHFAALGRRFRSLAVRQPLQLLGMPARWMDQGAADAASQVAQFLDREAQSRGRAASGRPFFLFVNLLEPHWRYLPPLRERLALLPDGIGPLAATAHSARFYGPLAMAGPDVPEPVRETIAALYAAEVRYQDRQLARLLAALDQRLDPARTLLIVTADHGENLGEAGRWDHVFALNDHLIRVPLLIRHEARFPAGERVSGMCQLVDVPATVAESVGGIALEPQQQGRDLAPAHFRGRRHVFAEGDPYLGHLGRMSIHAGFERDVARFSATLRAVRSDRHKYVWSSRGDSALYDLEDDPDESRNRIDEDPARALGLLGRLEAWRASQTVYEPRESEANRLSDSERRRLEALGYLP